MLCARGSSALVPDSRKVTVCRIQCAIPSLGPRGLTFRDIALFVFTAVNPAPRPLLCELLISAVHSHWRPRRLVMLPEPEEPVAPVKGAFGQQFLNGANIRSNFTIISFKYAYGQAVLRFFQML